MSNVLNRPAPFSQPWQGHAIPVPPTSRDQKHLQRLGEVLAEAAVPVAWCRSVGVEVLQPGRIHGNREWLEQQFAVLLANLELTMVHFNLDGSRIRELAETNKALLRSWFADGSAY